MHVKLKEGMMHVYKVEKIQITMQFSEDSDIEDHDKVLRTKEVFVIPIAIHPSLMQLPM
jgi:hypothetical protein